jgi:type VI protein secretion system component VasK
MFVDYSDQSNWSAWWPPLVWLLTASLSGWAWTTASLYIDDNACPSMARSLIAIGVFTVVSLLLITPLRHRRVSLDYTWYYFIAFTVATALCKCY